MQGEALSSRSTEDHSFRGSDEGFQITEKEAPKTGDTMAVYRLQPHNGCKTQVLPFSVRQPWHQRMPVAMRGDFSMAHDEIEGSLLLGPVHPTAQSSKPHPEALPRPGMQRGLSSPPHPTPRGVSCSPVWTLGEGSWFEFASQAGFYSRQPPSQSPTGTLNLFKVEIK